MTSGFEENVKGQPVPPITQRESSDPNTDSMTPLLHVSMTGFGSSTVYSIENVSEKLSPNVGACVGALETVGDGDGFLDGEGVLCVGACVNI
jgi:hypothetical protein